MTTQINVLVCANTPRVGPFAMSDPPARVGWYYCLNGPSWYDPATNVWCHWDGAVWTRGAPACLDASPVSCFGWYGLAYEVQTK